MLLPAERERRILERKETRRLTRQTPEFKKKNAEYSKNYKHKKRSNIAPKQKKTEEERKEYNRVRIKNYIKKRPLKFSKKKQRP